jgi:hypothetical protein
MEKVSLDFEWLSNPQINGHLKYPQIPMMSIGAACVAR